MRFLQSIFESDVDYSLATRRAQRDTQKVRVDNKEKTRTDGIEHRLVPLLDLLTSYIKKGRSPLTRKKILEYVPEAQEKSKTIDGKQWHIHMFPHIAYLLVYDLRNKDWSPLCDYVRAILSHANMPEAQWARMLNRYGKSIFVTDNSEPDYYVIRSGNTVTLCSDETKNNHLGSETMLWDKFLRMAIQGTPLGNTQESGLKRYYGTSSRPEFVEKWTQISKLLT